MMPVAFVAHGAPLLALDTRKGAELARWARSMPKPQLIVAVSAHWEREHATLGTCDHSQLYYDFSGFPQELYQLQYPAPGAPHWLERVGALLAKGFGPVHSAPQRRMDHGVWVPLLWMYPEADVPVLQVSLPKSDPSAALRLGRVLAPLREDGVLLLASGVLVHNLSRLDPRADSVAPEWARAFDEWCAAALQRRDIDALLAYRDRTPHGALAHPTAEHFTPLLVAVGAAAVGDYTVQFPVTGFEFGSISRRCVQLD
jgi:4,5-DOPA dioxygenase extradiol